VGSRGNQRVGVGWKSEQQRYLTLLGRSALYPRWLTGQLTGKNA
jgi:hypothetical protein